MLIHLSVQNISCLVIINIPLSIVSRSMSESRIKTLPASPAKKMGKEPSYHTNSSYFLILVRIYSGLASPSVPKRNKIRSWPIGSCLIHDLLGTCGSPCHPSHLRGLSPHSSEPGVSLTSLRDDWIIPWMKGIYFLDHTLDEGDGFLGPYLGWRGWINFLDHTLDEEDGFS